MVQNKGSIRRIITVLLAISFMLSSFFHLEYKVWAKEKVTAFQVYVISEVEETPYIGEFILADGEIYVSEETLYKMGNIECSIVIGMEDVAYWAERQGLDCYLSKYEVIDWDDRLYFPYIKTMGELCLSTTLYAKEQMLEVEQGADLTKLDSLLIDIYKNGSYNMSGWQNQTFLYESSYMAAVVTDITKNLNFISYYDPYKLNTAQKEQYQEAFWSILIPSNEDDVIMFIEETNDTVKTISKYKGFTDVISEAIDGKKESGFLGDCGKAAEIVGDVWDYMQLEEVMELYTYVRSMGEMDESYMRGLELILDAPSSSMNPFMKQKGQYALSLYREQTPVWQATLQAVTEGMIEDVEGKVASDAPKKLIGSGKIFSLACKLTSAALDKFLGTQSKVDATIQSHHILEIQKNCANYFQYYHRDLYTDSWEDEVATLQKLHDVMALYLRAGVAAYRVVSIDDELKANADKVIADMNADLEALGEYQERDFSVVTDAKSAAKAMTKSARKFAEKELEDLQAPVSLFDFGNMNTEELLAVLETYYNDMSSEDGTYLIRADEVTEDSEYLYYTLRYAMSDAEYEEYMKTHESAMGMSWIYVANVCIDKETGDVYEERVDSYGMPSDKTLIIKNEKK